MFPVLKVCCKCFQSWVRCELLRTWSSTVCYIRYNHILVRDGDLPTRKRGRPPIPLIEEVLERRRISRQRVNASRPKCEGPARRKRGRPKGTTKVVQDPHPLPRSSPVVHDSCEQGDTLAGTSQPNLASDQDPPTNSRQVWMVRPMHVVDVLVCLSRGCITWNLPHICCIRSGYTNKLWTRSTCMLVKRQLPTG